MEGDGLQRIPASGRLLIVANHPSGALDALALLDAVGKVRRDVRIVANDVLSLLQPLAGLLLPVRIFGGRAGARAIRAIEQSLAREECVIVFPAGEVSRWSPRGVRDGRWSTGFVRFARSTGAPVLPVRVQARNSALFYGASSVFRPAGTALLAREMFARRQRPVSLRIGTPMQLDCTAPSARVAEDMRNALYALRCLPAAAPPPAQEPIAPAMPTQAVCTAIAQTELLGQTADGKQIRLAQLRAGEPLLANRPSARNHLPRRRRREWPRPRSGCIRSGLRTHRAVGRTVRADCRCLPHCQRRADAGIPRTVRSVHRIAVPLCR